MEGLPWSQDGVREACSDELFHAVMAWGDEAAAARRVQEHFEAGADHLVVSVVTATPEDSVREQLRRLKRLLRG
ncbi:MAG TPA: hypothetical protein VIN39_06520 [Candidatus Dormibacteraeota bacterium]